MDPVTAIQLVASLLGLIKACRTSLQAIEDFRHGDDDLAELVRDVETFIDFVQGLELVLKHHQKTQRHLIFRGLRKALDDAHKTAQRLEKQLEHVHKSNSSVGRRLRWLQGRAQLEKLRGRIKHHNTSLTGFVMMICV